MKLKLILCCFLLASVQLFGSTPVVKNKVHSSDIQYKSNKNTLIYLNENRLEKVKELIKKEDAYFPEAYDQLIVEANKELGKAANPVTYKTQIPPSGDVHDFGILLPTSSCFGLPSSIFFPSQFLLSIPHINLFRRVLKKVWSGN